MPRDDIGILYCGPTDLKGVGDSASRWVGILMSAILFWFRFFHSDWGSSLLTIQSQALNAQRPTLNSEPGKA